MSLRPRDNFSTSDERHDLTLIGSVEVVSDGSGAIRCIRCLPPEDKVEIEPVKRADIISLQEDIRCERAQEDCVEYGLLESLSMSCAKNCECQCSPSILKTASKDDSNEISTRKRQVSFSRHEIREFDLTLGHHPGATRGPPVMLDYDSEGRARIVGVDEYEKERGVPRTLRQLKINPLERKHILTKQKGFSEAEVNQAWAEATQIRRQRQETLNRGLLLMFVDDFSESLSRKYNRLLDTLGLA